MRHDNNWGKFCDTELASEPAWETCADFETEWECEEEFLKFSELVERVLFEKTLLFQGSEE